LFWDCKYILQNLSNQNFHAKKTIWNHFDYMVLLKLYIYS